MQEYRWTRESIYPFDFHKGSRLLVLNYVHQLGLLVSLCHGHSYCRGIEDMSDLLKETFLLSIKTVLFFFYLPEHSSKVMVQTLYKDVLNNTHLKKKKTVVRVIRTCVGKTTNIHHLKCQFLKTF